MFVFSSAIYPVLFHNFRQTSILARWNGRRCESHYAYSLQYDPIWEEYSRVLESICQHGNLLIDFGPLEYPNPPPLAQWSNFLPTRSPRWRWSTPSKNFTSVVTFLGLFFEHEADMKYLLQQVVRQRFKPDIFHSYIQISLHALPSSDVLSISWFSDCWASFAQQITMKMPIILNYRIA